MNINEICRVIRFNGLTNSELNEIIEAVKYRRSHLTVEAKETLFPGLYVKFKDRAGRTIVGKVEKVSRKNVLVNTNTGRWRVAATLLSGASSEDMKAVGF